MYTRHWSYVIPQVIKRNSRFIEFNIVVVQRGTPEDPLNSILEVFPPGNYSYKCWNLDFPTLDPSSGELIDEGQMIMDNYDPPEIVQYTYISDNETLKNIIYYSGANVDNCTINYLNSPFLIIEDTTSLCQPLILDITGYAEIEDGVTFSLN